MRMIPVSSRSIRAIGYDDGLRRLYVQFRTGRTYTFFGVPAATASAFLRSSSKGRFFNAYIRGHYG
jgi:hypothetical protein